VYSLIEEYKGLPFDLKLPEKISGNKNVNQEIMQHLKESVKKNYHLGELLAE
jgi:antitoxin component of RelBE/YafQ-DinJ toxin-antitoxin module